MADENGTPPLRADALDEEDLGNGTAANDEPHVIENAELVSVALDPAAENPFEAAHKRQVPVVVDGVFHGMRDAEED